MYLIVVNPVSGDGKGAKVWKIVEPRLRANGVLYTVHFTTAPEEGTRYVRESLRAQGALNYTGVVVVGGDGTVNDVVNGIRQSGVEIPLGVIPGGSGNDLARSLGVNHWEKAIQTILAGHQSQMDLGFVNDRYFVINNIGVGFDATVSYISNRSWYKAFLNRIGLGKLTYAITLMRLLLSYRRMTMTIETEHGTHKWNKAWFVAVSNITNYGGGMQICPDAKADDGVFQAAIVHGLSRLRILLLFPLVFSGKHKGRRGVEFLEARKMTIRTDRPVYVHMDGEVKFQSPVTIENVPLAIRVFSPMR